MNRRALCGLTSVLSFVCLCAAGCLLCQAVGLYPLFHGEKFILGLIAVISGYAAVWFYCLGSGNPESRKKIIRTSLKLLFVFYIVMLIDFTLVDGSLGRNIQNIFASTGAAFQAYLKESTNFIPFATIRLFVNGYRNGNLSFLCTVENLLGNLAVLMPLPFFLGTLTEKARTLFFSFAAALAVSLTIELLQFVFLTGATDIDDVILNVLGAVLFAALLNYRRISRGISKLTFGVWKTVEKEA